MNIMKFRSLVFAAFLALPLASFAQVEFSVGWAPPPLPVYDQLGCAVAGYIWTQGYWGLNVDYYDYNWVPGVWVATPRVGLLWTPGWWGWRGGSYAFNQGYWGPHVGFYGGVNYGYGYTGNGYWGGRWSGNNFQYNTAVTRVNKTVINNTYVNNSFAKNVNANRTSFNGGNGGIKAQPNAEQRKAMTNANKVGPTSEQLGRQQAAAKDKNLLASTSKGKPNQEAIKSFNKTEGAGQGKGAQGLEAAGGAAGAGAGNKPGNLSERQGQGTPGGAGAGQGENKPGKMAEHNRQGEGAGQGQGGKGVGAGGEAGAGQGENKPGKMAEHRGQGEGMNAEEHGNKHAGNNQNLQGSQAKMRSGKGGQQGGPAHGQHAMSQQTPGTDRM